MPDLPPRPRGWPKRRVPRSAFPVFEPQIQAQTLPTRGRVYGAWRGRARLIWRNEAMVDYVRNQYGVESHIICYGGDHAIRFSRDGAMPERLPEQFALSICRIEPENNVHMILEAWSQLDMPLVYVGNWSSSAYGRSLKSRFGSQPNLYMLDPIYDPDALHAVRVRANLYVHGHSAGGTNPSLVEIMHFGVPVLAYDCVFNRHTTENRAMYFKSPNELVELVRTLTPSGNARVGADMLEIARRRYNWDCVGDAYFSLLLSPQTPAQQRECAEDRSL